MISNLIDSLKDQITPDLMQKVGLSPDKAGDVAKVIGNSASEPIEKMLAGGGIDDVMSLFSTGANSGGANQLLSGISASSVQAIAGKFGIDKSKAQSLVDAVIPKMVELVSSKGVGNLDSLTSMFGKGGSGDVLGKAKDALGGFFK